MNSIVPARRRRALPRSAKIGVAAAVLVVGAAALADTLFRYDNNGNLHVVTDPVTDPNNCGGPGAVCPGYPNANPVCSRGACGAACAAGWGNCDGAMSSNGCETRINSPTQCGACGLECPTPENGRPACIEQCAGETCQARCGVSCFPDFTDCGGRCVSLVSDAENCAACGHVCPGLTNGYGVCAGAACGLACHPPYAMCGGACLDPLASPATCKPEDEAGVLAECVDFPVWDMVRVDFGDNGSLVARRLPQCAGLGVKWPSCLDPFVLPGTCEREDTGGILVECVEFPSWDMVRAEFAGDGALVPHHLAQCAGLAVQWPF